MERIFVEILSWAHAHQHYPIDNYSKKMHSSNLVHESNCASTAKTETNETEVSSPERRNEPVAPLSELYRETKHVFLKETDRYATSVYVYVCVCEENTCSNVLDLMSVN